MVGLSPVQQMFQGRSLFITGASGFIGRVLLEKLLRCYPGLERIYLLMRAKKGQAPQDRLHQQLLKVPIFDAIKAMPNAQQLLDKLVVITGDIALPGLGISTSDLDTMLNDPTLSIVIHSAATIKFDEPLKVSVQLNLIATREIIQLCRRLPNLISLCHVSTAFVNSHLKNNQDIEERVYPISEKPELLIKMADCWSQELMQELKVKLVDQRPNTYTYTKALAEHLILEEASDLPVAIVRPSIVVAAWREPVPGWIDNLNGPTGVILAVGKGLIRSLYALRNVKADIIPVDVVVNTMIASTFYAAKTNRKLESREKEEEEIVQEQQKSTPIIHCTSGDVNPITWGTVEDYFPVIRKFPSSQVFRYPFGTFKSNKYHDLFARFFAHYLPALIIDLICACMGKKRQLLFIYGKLHAAVEALAHFRTTNYNFKTKNLYLVEKALVDERDQECLYLNIKPLNWYDFWHDYVLGARRYVLKESDSSLPKAQRSFRRAYYMEIAFRLILILLTGACLLPVLARWFASNGSTLAGGIGGSSFSAVAADPSYLQHQRQLAFA